MVKSRRSFRKSSAEPFATLRTGLHAGLVVFSGPILALGKGAVDMCGIIGYVGGRPAKPLLLQGLRRLEYRGYDSAGIALNERDGLAYVRAVGNLENLVELAGPNGSMSRHGARSYALGNARRCHRAERASAGRLRRRQARDRPERDRRELPRGEESARRGRSLVHVGDRRRGRRAPARARVRRRPRRRARPRLPAARGPLHDRRDPSRPSRPARRRSPRDAARRRLRRLGELPRLERRRLPQRDQARRVPRRRRGRRDHAVVRAFLSRTAP